MAPLRGGMRRAKSDAQSPCNFIGGSNIPWVLSTRFTARGRAESTRFLIMACHDTTRDLVLQKGLVKEARACLDRSRSLCSRDTCIIDVLNGTPFKYCHVHSFAWTTSLEPDPLSRDTLMLAALWRRWRSYSLPSDPQSASSALP